MKWPDTPEAALLRAWITPLWRDGTGRYIRNVHTTMHVVVCGDVVLPISEGSMRGDSYVVAPHGHYVDYALDETRHMGWVTRTLARLAAIPLSAWCRFGRLDHVVMVNNWLLSTNLYPALDEVSVHAIHEAVRARFPDRTVVWRSVDTALRADLHGWLTDRGARMVFARRIHVVRHGTAVLKRSNNKRDAKLARSSPWQPVEQIEPERAAWLYGKLYLEKYSRFNPVFEPALIAEAVRNGVWSVTAWANQDEADVVIGTWTLSGVLTTPLLGYDTSLPADVGLYRIACRGILDQSVQEGVIANRSAGAAAFKQSRGATSHLEYNAVFDREQGWRRRLPWGLLQWILDRLVVPMIERQNL